MRIAISGTHRSGKTSLVEALAAHLPKHDSVEEPYRALEEDGYEFSHPPALEDFEEQLEWSLERLHEDETAVVFDRCPVDILAYIAEHEEADSFDLEEHMPRVRAAMQTLDLIVFVPIEPQDRIAFSRSDDEQGSRGAVDGQLREILVEDAYDFGVEVLEVAGSLEQRLRMVLQRIQER
ncbi:MAG TPA: ATP-binding protein [Polyangiales bacterium]|nr:ATP-binding protein [Polyangiales bacterium]